MQRLLAAQAVRLVISDLSIVGRFAVSASAFQFLFLLVVIAAWTMFMPLPGSAWTIRFRFMTTVSAAAAPHVVAVSAMAELVVPPLLLALVGSAVRRVPCPIGSPLFSLRTWSRLIRLRLFGLHLAGFRTLLLPPRVRLWLLPLGV